MKRPGMDIQSGRRGFLKTAALGAAALLAPRPEARAATPPRRQGGPHMKLSLAGCRERDRFVLQMCKKNGIPVAISMGGGYSRQLAQIVEAHANTFRAAQEIFF